MYYQNNVYGNRNNLGYGLDLGSFNFPTLGINTLRGKVVDFTTNKPLENAHVYYLKNGIKEGVTTNVNGEYQLEVPVNSLITITFLGYETIQDAASNIGEVEFLSPKAEQLDPVYITNEKPTNKYLLAGVGVAAALFIVFSVSNNENKKE